MKKKVFILLFAALLCLMLTCTAYASEVGENEEVKSYIENKIVPVVVGVLTAVIALLTTLGSVAKSLRELKDTRSDFKSEADTRREYSKSLEREAQKLQALLKDVPELKERLDTLAKECYTLGEILALGFSSNSEVVKSGKGRQMSVLLERAGIGKEIKEDEKA